MEYQKFLQEVNRALRLIIGRELSVADTKLAKKLYNQRYTADDAVSVLLTKI